MKKNIKNNDNQLKKTLQIVKNEYRRKIRKRMTVIFFNYLFLRENIMRWCKELEETRIFVKREKVTSAPVSEKLDRKYEEIIIFQRELVRWKVHGKLLDIIFNFVSK